MHDQTIYTGNKKNKPLKYGASENSLDDEAYNYEVPLYGYPKQKILPPRKSEPQVKVQVEALAVDSEATPKVVAPKIKKDMYPDTYLMPDGKKYTHEELLEAYPAMKDERVFKKSFGK